MDKEYILEIARHRVRMSFAEGSGINTMELLPAMDQFVINDDSPGNLLFELTVDDSLQPSKERKKLQSFDTGNGDTIVYTLPDGGYEYIIKDIRGRSCSLLHASRDFTSCRCALNGDWGMRSFGLNDALMLVYAFAGSHHGTVLVHASCVRNGGMAYPFIAKSGTGKSTHSSLWLKNIEATDLMNDDNPIIRIIDGKAILFGSPWSGKTPCYRNIEASLGAVTRIERGSSNSIERLSPTQAFASLLPACSSMKWDSVIYNNLCDILSAIIAVTPVYTLHCLPDDEAAWLCHATIAGNNR